MSALFTPYQLGPVTLRNRTIRSAAFESMGRHFGPTQQLKDYHVSVARGGVGMTTLAYAAVCRSGLSFDKQLWLRPEIVPGLREITDAVHREGAAAGIQIGHCGNMTHLTTAGQIPIGASTGFNLYAYTPVRGMRAGEIEQVARDFGRAVHTAHDAGFDSVEVHAGHGYLISQFLSPYTNRRRDEYGGSLENRAVGRIRVEGPDGRDAGADSDLHDELLLAAVAALLHPLVRAVDDPAVPVRRVLFSGGRQEVPRRVEVSAGLCGRAGEPRRH